MTRRKAPPGILVGARWGLWVVTARPKYERGEWRCACRCACGTVRKVVARTLTVGSSRSCGCAGQTRIVGTPTGMYKGLRRRKRPSVSLVGSRFAHLLVIGGEARTKAGRAVLLCRCDCGAETVASGSQLRSGRRKSCGCIGRTDLTGQRFGHLVVQARGGVRNRPWVCKCDCGTVRTMAAASLYGRTNGCGCDAYGAPARPNKKGPGVAALHALFVSYQKSASKRRLAFKLKEPEAMEMFGSDCHYCGAKPSTMRTSSGGWSRATSNGIDRIDNRIGYVSGNMVPCCKVCNMMKHTLGVADFFAAVKRIYEKNDLAAAA